MGCDFEILPPAQRDLSALTEEEKRKLTDKLCYLALNGPESLDRRSYRDSRGRTFCKKRHGRHRCYLLGHSKTCSFSLHTVVVNKDEHFDPGRPRLEGKLSRR